MARHVFYYEEDEHITIESSSLFSPSAWVVVTRALFSSIPVSANKLIVASQTGVQYISNGRRHNDYKTPTALSLRQRRDDLYQRGKVTSIFPVRIRTYRVNVCAINMKLKPNRVLYQSSSVWRQPWCLEGVNVRLTMWIYAVIWLLFLDMLQVYYTCRWSAWWVEHPSSCHHTLQTIVSNFEGISVIAEYIKRYILLVYKLLIYHIHHTIYRLCMAKFTGLVA